MHTRAVARAGAALTLAVLALGGGQAGPAARAAAGPATRVAAAAGTGTGAGAIPVAAARVAALTEEYRRRSAAAATAAARLARAYTAIAAADDDAQAARDDVDRSRGRLAEQARALYALGAAAHGELFLLTADSPQDGLWQLAVGAPLAERLLGDTAAAQREAQQRAVVADQRSAAALRAAGQVSDLLAALHTEQDAAAWAREQALGELRRLQSAARNADLARQAALRLEVARQQADATRLAASGPVGALSIPPDVGQAYHDAATTCAGLDWTLLAAVGQVESGHGRNNGPSSAGAIGPMQFMPATFAAYAVDGDGDGVTDPWNTRDAVFTAAHYLCASGAGLGPVGVHAALLTYNHAEWYVDLVLAAQRAIVAREQQRAS